MDRISTRLLERLLQSYINEYNEVRTTFDRLDTKAQNTTAIDAVFLAAALAFFDGDTLGKLDYFSKSIAIPLIGISIVCILCSILCCLYCLQIRKVAAPLKSDCLSELINDILDVKNTEDNESLVERHESLLRDQILIWRKILNSKSMNTETKGNSILYGQILLIVAVLLVAILLIFVLGYV